MGFLGIVGRIIEHVPFAISMVERFFGNGSGTAKKLAASKEILEFVRELIEKNPAGEWDEVEEVDLKSLMNALEDEEEFVEHIMAVNDAVVTLTNYINSKKEEVA